EIDAAVLDVNLRGRTVYAVAEVLTERGVPFLFTTGYDRVDWDARVPVLRKPFQPRTLVDGLRRLLAAAAVPA
ncbi:MAG TPA: two-component system response regulator protein-glutamate methylesterase, partial [Azospirillaceae bacterium]|nr:two-component system response regulator protein-glutamate methylesterase [Azospirillaceae bacterium]HYE52595.1 two-component system response regulator protein-glutamate methylesterase [Azospirillaceae bacterium]